MSSTIFDATHRRRYEQELLLAQRQAEQLAAIVTNASDAIVSAAPDGIVESWNTAAEALFGVQAGDALGRGVREHLFIGEDDADFERLLDSLREGQAVRLDTKGKARDGHVLDISVRRHIWGYSGS